MSKVTAAPRAPRRRHEGRLAETYRRDGDRLIFTGYTADPPAGAAWSTELAAWILNDEQEES